MVQTQKIGKSTTVAAQASKARVLIAVMLFVTVVINYMDRANLSIAMPAIADEMDLTKAQQGLLLSAFGWTYAALQIPGGWLVDRIPPRLLYPGCLILWSIATPIVIGLLVTDDSFAPGFVYMTVVTAVGVASYVFLVGRVERVRS